MYKFDVVGNPNNPKELKVLDYRLNVFSDDDAIAVIDDVGSGRHWQVQVRCDSQLLANRIRSKIFGAATKDGRCFEMTILGNGAAVGVKMHIMPKYVWDESRGREIPIEQWNAEHPDNKVREK